MNDDYLWDGSGDPDPEIKRLESALGRLRHDRPTPEFPPITVLRPRKPAARHSWGRWFLPAMATICLALMVVLASPWWRPRAPHAGGWDVISVSGSPRIGQTSFETSEGAGRIAIGQTLETDAGSRARIRVADVGEIRIDPDTSLRVLASPNGGSRLALDRGTIHARIWARPGNFVVDTPSARAVDLGCAYSLQVDDAGNGLILTTLGWVAFKFGDREAFIPAGAACATRAKSGPNTPYFEDASDAFRAALSAFDRADGSKGKRSIALRTILATARSRDALTLWHLLARVDESERALVYDQLAKRASPPKGVTREGILRLDGAMLDAWWNRLDLGDISLWRHWERSWPQTNPSQDAVQH